MLELLPFLCAGERGHRRPSGMHGIYGDGRRLAWRTEQHAQLRFAQRAAIDRMLGIKDAIVDHADPPRSSEQMGMLCQGVITDFAALEDPLRMVTDVRQEGGMDFPSIGFDQEGKLDPFRQNQMGHRSASTSFPWCAWQAAGCAGNGRPRVLSRESAASRLR